MTLYENAFRGQNLRATFGISLPLHTKLPDFVVGVEGGYGWESELFSPECSRYFQAFAAWDESPLIHHKDSTIFLNSWD